MKNKKGYALLYAIAIMIVVFSICSLIIANTLALSSYSDAYSIILQNQRLSAQIAEIYCDTNGNVALFSEELSKNGFFVDNSDIPQVTKEDTSFYLDISSPLIVIIYNDSIRLTVELRDNNGVIEITKWEAQKEDKE